MKVTLKTSLVFVTAICFTTLAASLRADQQITGTYSIGDGSDGNQATGTGTGPFTLTATNSTFSYVDFIPTVQTYTFADLTNLNSIFDSATPAGGGTPRLSVELSNGVQDAYIHIFLGTSPSYTDTAASLNTYSGFNLIGNNDAGRYDTSQFTGGSPFTDYSSTLGLLGSFEVKDIAYVVDTFGAFGDRSIELDSINAFVTDAAVPEPSTWIGASLAALLLIFEITRARSFSKRALAAKRHRP